MSTPAILSVQQDFVGRLQASPDFSDVAIMAIKKGYTENEIAALLKTIKGQSGKIGTCVLVQKPVLDVIDPNLPGPNTAITQSMLVIEHPTLNFGSQGSQKSAEFLAEEALILFHHFTPYGISQVFVGVQNAIVPVELEGLSAYMVTLTAPRRFPVPGKVVRPVIAVASGTVTLSCATSGAAIYYTTDDSYPSAQNAEATLYTVPFAVAEDCTVRAAASKAAMQQSDVALLAVEAADTFSGENADEVPLTITDLINDNPGIEVLRLTGLPLGRYAITGVLHFALVDYVKPDELAAINLEGGDPGGVLIQQTVWVGEYDPIPTPINVADAGPGAFGQAGYNEVECTSGSIVLHLTSVSMTAGSIVLPPGGLSVILTPVP